MSHKRELSLLRALVNPISLEIYINRNGTAIGELILDDGWSTKPDYSKFIFTYARGVLSYKSSVSSSFITDKVINEIKVYGV